MKKLSQKQIVVNQLKQTGKISRNFCLRNYISRLSAIIFNLEREGWSFTGEFEKTGNGKDYVYKVLRSPYKKVRYFVPELNKYITKFEKQ